MSAFLIPCRSTKVKCPYCDSVSLSIVEYQPSLLGYLLVLLSMLIFGFMSLILLPLLVSLTKQAIHRCAKCLNEVKSNSYFGYSSMDDKVSRQWYDTLQLLSIQIGKFGVIFTRKQLLYSVIVMTACLAIYVFILVEEGHNHEIGKSRTQMLISVKFRSLPSPGQATVPIAGSMPSRRVQDKQ